MAFVGTHPRWWLLCARSCPSAAGPAPLGDQCRLVHNLLAQALTNHRTSLVRGQNRTPVTSPFVTRKRPFW